MFKIELLAISMQELPDADDELAKDVSDFDTMEALRADIRGKMTETAQKQAENQFESAVFDTLIAATDAAVPSVMYERRISQMVRDFEQNLRRQYNDMTLADYLSYTGMTEQQMRDTYEEQARKEVLLRLALEKIADLEGIEVSDEELEDGLQDFAAKVGVSLEVVKAQIPMADFKLDMRVTKAVELVKSNAVVDNDMAPAAEEAPAEETAEATDAE